jgi:hypothetical protein
MRTRRLLLYLTLALLSQPGFCAVRPSFRLDLSAWRATDIVVVTSTPDDGVFEVAESWKGELAIGEKVTLPELRPDRHAPPISKYPKSESDMLQTGVSEQIPRQPAGARMILFLVGPGVSKTWKPSDLMSSMKASVLWMDHGQIFSFGQLFNPGPSVLHLSRLSEGEVRSRVAEIRGTQERAKSALAVLDGAERAERLRVFVNSNVPPARTFALEELGKCGPTATRAISGMLDDPAFADESPELIKALADAGGSATGPEMHRRLQQELTFWKSMAPSLAPDWWNQDPSIHVPLWQHYGQTHQLILGLKQINYLTSLSTVVELRDLWQSSRSLSDGKQLIEECNEWIAHPRD